MIKSKLIYEIWFDFLFSSIICVKIMQVERKMKIEFGGQFWTVVFSTKIGFDSPKRKYFEQLLNANFVENWLRHCAKVQEISSYFYIYWYLSK